MDSIQTDERIMDRAGIYPGPICQILNLLYSFFLLLYDGSWFTLSHQENGRGKWSFASWLLNLWSCVESCLDARRDPSHICSSRTGEHIQGSEIHTSQGQGLGRGLASWQLCPGSSVPTVSASAPHVHSFSMLCNICSCPLAVKLVASPFQLHQDGV